MKHAILGAGAVGGLLATVLASLGEEVVAIVRPERLSDYPADFFLERPSGTLNAPVKTSTTLSEPVDVLWIATKTFQLQSALQSVTANARCVIPLLNGADHVGVLRKRFGHDAVVPATIGVEAEKLAPGRYLQRSPFVKLNLAASGEAQLSGVISGLSQQGFTCQIIGNEQTLLWNKLCFLGPFALVTTASGLNNGGVAQNERWRTRLTDAVSEACAVATALGAEVDASKIHAFIGSASPEMRSSMQKDLEAGRSIEMDDIAGPILRGGKRNGISVNTIEDLVAVIRHRLAARKTAASS